MAKGKYSLKKRYKKELTRPPKPAPIPDWLKQLRKDRGFKDN